MKHVLLLLLMLYSLSAYTQGQSPTVIEQGSTHKYRISIPLITVPQLFMDDWNERKHTQHIEIHIKRNLDDKNTIGLKFATWRLFQPMGITWWDGLLDKLDTESEFYPGHVRERGIGVTYQRMIWKGLFATVEVLPQFQTYMDENGDKLGNDFKLYNSYHLGYRISFGKDKRFFVEPQVHCQHWMLDNDAPDGFSQLDDKWRNYFLFEPNLYFGINF